MPALTRHFLQQSAKQLGVEPKRISDAALAQLATFGFPGNVRQLENICHWLTVMAPAQLVEVKDLPPEVMAVAPSKRQSHARPRGRAGVRVLVATGRGMPRRRRPLRWGHVRAASMRPARPMAPSTWESGLEREAQTLLAAGRNDVWDALSRRFESRLILTALANTRGRRIEAAQKLGIGRNTITRKIQELGLE